MLLFNMVSLQGVGRPTARGIGAAEGEVCRGVGVPGVRCAQFARLGPALWGRQRRHGAAEAGRGRARLFVKE